MLQELDVPDGSLSPSSVLFWGRRIACSHTADPAGSDLFFTIPSICLTIPSKSGQNPTEDRKNFLAWRVSFRGVLS
jgi:hypothetical protein